MILSVTLPDAAGVKQSKATDTAEQFVVWHHFKTFLVGGHF